MSQWFYQLNKCRGKITIYRSKNKTYSISTRVHTQVWNQNMSSLSKPPVFSCYNGDMVTDLCVRMVCSKCFPYLVNFWTRDPSNNVQHQQWMVVRTRLTHIHKQAESIIKQSIIKHTGHLTGMESGFSHSFWWAPICANIWEGL